MKIKNLLLQLFAILLFVTISSAQRVWIEPVTGTSMTINDPVKIFLDKQASTFWDQGPNGVFMHAGVAVQSPTSIDWTYGNGLWTELTASRKMTKEGNFWVMTITPKTYFNIPDGVTAFRIQLLFRNEYTGVNDKLDNGGQNYFLTLQQPAVGGVVSLSPNPTDDQNITLTFRAAQGATKSLTGVNKVYFHSAAITSSPTSTTWEKSRGNWGADDGVGLMTAVAGQANTWQITFNPRTYYGVTDVNEDIYRLTYVFRNATGTLLEKDGANDFITNINPGYNLILNQPVGANSVAPINTAVPVQAVTPTASTFTVRVDGVVVNTVSNVTSLNYNASFTTAGNRVISVTATNGTETKVKTQTVSVFAPVGRVALPSGMRYGINYHANDPTKATLVLHLPTQTKNVVHVIGEFNNWQVTEAFKMNRTPAGDVWWITLNGLTSGQEYIFQYLIDGTIRVADPYASKISDPWNDQWITSAVFPGLKPYPSANTSNIASYIQTNRPKYTWQINNFTPVSHNKLNVYELHVRDFTTEGTYKAATARLDYIANMGINCIHMMPVSEFEGNDSWGYNPNFYFASDKAYGTENDLKQFIDEAHKRGIAVINDLVLNHAFGTNAMAQMYWDAANSKPAGNNPWFNANHNFVNNRAAWWGNDFNHDSGHTRAFIDSVNAYWMKEFKFDGFRFDFTKGFSNTQYIEDWNWGGTYDGARVFNLKRMVDAMRARNPNAIVVFEHLADRPENSELANYGILQWGGKGVTEKYEEIVLGWGATDITNSNSKAPANGFQFDNLMSYMESHDEQRLGYHIKQYGRTFIKNSETEQFKRLKLAGAFNMLIPGPRMVWQFGELGYDVNIDFNGRTGRKPVRWDYFDVPGRRDIYNTYSLVLGLRKKYNVMHNCIGLKLDQSNWVKELRFRNADTTVLVLANFEAFNTSDPNNAGHAAFFDVPTGLPAGNYYEASSGTWQTLGTTVRINAGDYRIYSTHALPLTPSTTIGLSGSVTVTGNLNFGNVRMNTTATRVITLVNNTNQTLNVSSLTLPAQFTTNWASGSLAPGTSRAITITFSPNNTISYSGNVVINTNMPSFTQNSISATGNAAIVRVEPGTFTKNSAIKVRFFASNSDASGTAGLVGAAKVYMHSGVVTASSTSTTWTNVIGTWGVDNGVGNMTKTAGTTDDWEINLTPSTYYAVPSATPVFRLAMVFRSANGSAQGKGIGGTDIFVNVSQSGARYGEIEVLSEPSANSVLLFPNPVTQNENINLEIVSNSEKSVSISILDLTGKTVVNRNQDLVVGVNALSLLTSSLKSGAYIVHIAELNYNGKIFIE